MDTYVAKTGAGFKLLVKTEGRGVRFVPQSTDDNREFADYESMTLSWAEWERLAAWINFQRADQALQPGR